MGHPAPVRRLARVTGDPAMDEAGKEMVLAFGLDHVVVDRERPTDPGRAVYTSNTAVRRGKLAITVESGGMGSRPHHR